MFVVRNYWQAVKTVFSEEWSKYEEVHRNEYRDLAEARSLIGAFLEKIYNRKRLHSALGYVPPRSSKLTSSNNKRKPLRGSFFDKFFQASGNLSIRYDSIGPGTASPPPPASSFR